MVKVVDLSIPPGLEDLFFKFFQFGNATTQTSYNTKSHTRTRAKRKSFKDRSLFVLWQSLYDGFDVDRKVAWTAYWITLPFGGHGGANGWPGSGFSAFVYINAPLYKAGEDLQLDPPAGNLIPNGDFSAGDTDWDTTNVTIASGLATFLPVLGGGEINNGAYMFLDLIFGHTYRFSGNISAGTGSVVSATQSSGGGCPEWQFELPAGYGDFSFDHVAVDGDTEVAVDFYTEGAYSLSLSNLSIIDLGVI